MERMASSLPAIGYSTSVGSVLVSTMATIGTRNRRASASALCSRLISMMIMASGLALRSRMPLRRRCRRDNSRRSIDCSCMTNSAILPSDSIASSSSMRLMERLMVFKLVIMPPSQRSQTYGWPVVSAVSLMVAWACFLVPTRSTLPPLETIPLRNSAAVSICDAVFTRSMMWMPFRASKMNSLIFGFHLRVWCPKCTPASNSSFTLLILWFSNCYRLNPLYSRPVERRDLVRCG